MKKKILIVFGGDSPEYFVSCSSASSMVEHLNKDKYEIHKIGVTQKGDWLYTESSFEEMKDGKAWTKHKSNKEVVPSLQHNKKGFYIKESDGWKFLNIDIVFPIIHGGIGENGDIQGLFEVMGIPYVGCDVPSSANGMNKRLTNIFAEKAGLKLPKSFFVRKNKYKNIEKEILQNIKELELKYPVFVKPVDTGSSIGISKVFEELKLEEAVNLAFEFSNELMVEEFIEGSEIKIAIMGDLNDIKIGEICEIFVEKGIFNSYETKYGKNSARKDIPAKLSKKVKDLIWKQSIDLYKIMGCHGYARIDFFKKGEEIYFNEINTVPGLTKTSVFSIMFSEQGKEYSDLLDEIISLG